MSSEQPDRTGRSPVRPRVGHPKTGTGPYLGADDTTIPTDVGGSGRIEPTADGVPIASFASRKRIRAPDQLLITKDDIPTQSARLLGGFGLAKPDLTQKRVG